LKQLPQAGDEEATERRDDVARRSLSCHVVSTSHNTGLQNPLYGLTDAQISSGWRSDRQTLN
jgi:hypothetical protein